MSLRFGLLYTCILFQFVKYCCIKIGIIDHAKRVRHALVTRLILKELFLKGRPGQLEDGMKKIQNYRYFEIKFNSYVLALNNIIKLSHLPFVFTLLFNYLSILI